MYATDTTKGSRSLLFLQVDPSKGCRLNQQEAPLDLAIATICIDDFT